MIRMRRAPSSGRNGLPFVAERALDGSERLAHADPTEAVHPIALVPVAGTAPDVLAEELVAVFGSVWKPDFGHRRAEDSDRGHAHGGADVERTPVIRDENIQRRDDGEILTERTLCNHWGGRPTSATRRHAPREGFLAGP